MKILAFLVTSLFFVATPVTAGTCDSNLCVAKVKKLYPHENGNIYIQADGDMSSLDCTLNQGVFMVLEKTHSLHSEIYSMLLSAHIAQKDVTMRISNGSANCKVVYTQLNL